MTIAAQLERADRLHVVTQRVGYTLWQIQELEGVAAQCFVLLAQATKGMGMSEGNALLDKALAGTFGATITKLRDAGVLPLDVEAQLRALLKERNWLVHSSRSTSRAAVHSDEALAAAIQRIDGISGSTLFLMKRLGDIVESHVKKHGVTDTQIDQHAAKILEAWHSGDVL